MAAKLAGVQFLHMRKCVTMNTERILDLTVQKPVREGPKLKYRYLYSRYFLLYKQYHCKDFTLEMIPLQQSTNYPSSTFRIWSITTYLFIIITILHHCFHFTHLYPLTAARYYSTEFAPDLEDEDKLVSTYASRNTYTAKH